MMNFREEREFARGEEIVPFVSVKSTSSVDHSFLKQPRDLETKGNHILFICIANKTKRKTGTENIVIKH